jgi:DNA-binding protein H-NS
MTNLAQLALPQLRQLQSKIAKEIDKRQSASKADLLKKITKLAKENGLSLDDVIGRAAPAAPKPKKSAASAPAVARKEPLPAKYRHPNNRELAWSGRGRRPGWIDAWVANGGSMDALEVAAQKMARKVAKKAAAEQPVAVEQQGEAVAAD